MENKTGSTAQVPPPPPKAQGDVVVPSTLLEGENGGNRSRRRHGHGRTPSSEIVGRWIESVPPPPPHKQAPAMQHHQQHQQHNYHDYGSGSVSGGGWGHPQPHMEPNGNDERTHPRFPPGVLKQQHQHHHPPPPPPTYGGYPQPYPPGTYAAATPPYAPQWAGFVAPYPPLNGHPLKGPSSNETTVTAGGTHSRPPPPRAVTPQNGKPSVHPAKSRSNGDGDSYYMPLRYDDQLGEETTSLLKGGGGGGGGKQQYGYGASGMGGGGGSAIGAGRAHPLKKISPRQGQHKKPAHRRVRSDSASTFAKQSHPLLKKSTSISRDIAAQGAGHHRRLGSGEKVGLPPVAPSSKGHHRRNSSRGSSTFGETFHRRGASFSSAVSMTSSMSVGSYVTDITKSALFKGVSETGMAQFHLPQDNIHIVMDSDLEEGKIYKDVPPDEGERFLEYYLFASDANHSWQDLLDEDDEVVGGCNCHCDYCANCTNRKHDLLPSNKYALVVPEDLYKRLFKEVSDSRTMPCKLFFCGHHEDVSQPSILIAAALVSILFASMAFVAFFVQA